MSVWGTVCRVVCCPCDCAAGHMCGGNGCTKYTDDVCLDPVVLGVGKDNRVEDGGDRYTKHG